MVNDRRPTQENGNGMLQGASVRVLKQLGWATIVLASVGIVSSVQGQAAPTATQTLQLTAFAGATGVYTGLNVAYGGTSQGRNASFTAGIAAGFRPLFSFYPSIEVRGTYPIRSGSVTGEKNVLGGLVVARHYGRLHPYADFFIGRGALSFVTPYPNPAGNTIYVQTASTVLAPGAGVDLFVWGNFAAKADFQLERYETPVTASGSLYSKALTLGVLYRIGGGGLSRLGR
jgi:hypothetical protein